MPIRENYRVVVKRRRRRTFLIKVRWINGRSFIATPRTPAAELLVVPLGLAFAVLTVAQRSQGQLRQESIPRMRTDVSVDVGRHRSDGAVTGQHLP